MTFDADMILSEIKLLFDQTIDDLILYKYEILAKENQLSSLSQRTDINELKDKLHNLEIKYQMDKDYYISEMK
jgi:hypothetical protein